MLLGYLCLCTLVFIAEKAQAQTTQTLRGKIVDAVSNQPLIGVNVIVASSGVNIIGSTTDVEGNYRIVNVPVGRQTLQITYVGYESQTIPNVVVSAGKEVVLNLALTESISQLNEVVITANSKEDKTATNNELAIVSARSFNVDDTKRYAGALGDPSRMAANFAGVVGGNDSRNDLVVRGNSSLGMLWQLEGMNIPNPNHFGSLSSTGGPVSILNNNNLAKSDFMTSAFPAQYGNATAGVFDLSMRDGNNEKRELLAQVGFNGFEAGAEGPFSKKSKASYIINARYSTLGVFQALGLEFGTGSNTPVYEDVNVKVSLPTHHGGKWTLFGMGGLSKIDLLGSKANLDKDTDLYGDENQDAFPRYRTGIAGVSYEKNLSGKTFAKWTAGITTTRERYTVDSLVRNTENEVVDRYLRLNGKFDTHKYALNFLTRTKFDSKNSITSGFYIDATAYNLFLDEIYAVVGRDSVRYQVDDRSTLYQAYTTWKHRFSQKLSAQAGWHSQYYDLNKQWVAEPRVGMQYIINGKHVISAGYGLHHQAQHYFTSLIQTRTSSGQIAYTNRHLDFTRSNHFVLTHDWNISDQLRMKTEVYYQNLSKVPVERKLSSFSVLNTGTTFGPQAEDSLVNKGSGRNYGFELTLERFFSRGFYFLVTTSLFDSRYKGSDGIQRNTAFNTHYVLNVLAGKEWQLGNKTRFFSVNIKFSTVGGKYLTPIDLQRSLSMGRTVYVESAAFSERQDAYLRADLRFAYRKEFERSTLEVSLDLQNLTNHKNIFSQNFNPRTGAIATQYQQAFFPVPYVRFTF
jgi:hypothetical protein